ncbi:hypothetical protein Hrd1104_00685 [Halorhabdus sp. CBA1104]|uniref:hypothetical protein n=1 Tax=Halorhabdus sp. CBA1104 TaxID=1380432 RepID=UPI0012B1CF0F|nr:hypothetical protein [Halorhabdus sp. CBA1104]QGN05951.1 hypothetical protein Hrd1104_00685 [Halorhabdus sp. CBA1104]
MLSGNSFVFPDGSGTGVDVGVGVAVVSVFVDLSVGSGEGFADCVDVSDGVGVSVADGVDVPRSLLTVSSGVPVSVSSDEPAVLHPAIPPTTANPIARKRFRLLCFTGAVKT